MRLFTAFRLLIAVCVAFWLAIPAQGAIVIWTDWTSATTGPDTVTGSMGDVGVTYTGDYTFVQLGTGVNYWTEPDPGSRPYTGSATVDNAPTPIELIALDAPATHAIAFSMPVANPVMAIVSLGRSDTDWTITYDFDTPFTVLSEGKGYWGDGTYAIGDGDLLYGNELHCAIQFQGTLSAITWTSTPSEYWHGFTVGDVIPEPATITIWLLLGMGSWLGMRIWRRGRRVGRQPWSDENRQAIHELLDCGTQH